VPKKKELSEDEIIQIYKAYVIPKIGCKKVDLLKGIEENLNCTRPTAYAVLYDHQHLFNYDQKKRVFRILSTYYFDTREFDSPPVVSEVNAYLDRVVKFVNKKDNPEDFLICVDCIREQVKDGILDDLDKLEVMLYQRFKEEASFLIEESQGIRETASKEPVPTIREPTPEEVEAELRIESESPKEDEVVEMVQDDGGEM